MKTVKHYTWEVIVSTTPLLKRKCSKCNSNSLFYCSNKFRLNSQKKYIDIWLIYKCQDCDTTYNLTILSRTKPDAIDKVLLQKFIDNDDSLARQYAFDSEIVKKNRIEPDYSQIEFNVIKEDLSMWQLAEIDTDIIEFEIKTEYNMIIKLNHIIKESLEISTSRLSKMLSMGIIQLFPAGTTQKQKVQNGMKVILVNSKLKVFLQEIPND